jgi:CheY-like chemotaxis protein
MAEVAESPSLEFKKRIKILAVEDDDINFLYVRELFRDSNCDLIRAKNGSEAVELFSKTENIDIILMDLKMPGMDGYEATKSIKEVNPEIPVIAVTSFELQDDLIKASGIRFDGYIAKPIIKDELLRKVINILN